MVGRRGPAQAKFTTKELRELGELLNADIDVDPAELELSPQSAAAAAADATTGKNVEVLEAFARQEPEGKPRTVALRSWNRPVSSASFSSKATVTGPTNAYRCSVAWSVTLAASSSASGSAPQSFTWW